MIVLIPNICLPTCFHTGKFSLGTSLVQLDTEIDVICLLSVNPLMTFYILKYGSLNGTSILYLSRALLLISPKRGFF